MVMRFRDAVVQGFLLLIQCLLFVWQCNRFLAIKVNGTALRRLWYLIFYREIDSGIYKRGAIKWKKYVNKFRHLQFFIYIFTDQMRFPVKEMSYSIQEKSSEKLYRCEVCNKGFNHRGDWTRHLRVHTGEKPYKCDICQRAFSLKSNLKTHYVVHLNRQNMI